MKTRGIIVGALIGPGVLGLFTAFSPTPLEVRTAPFALRSSMPGKMTVRRTPGGALVECSPGTERRADRIQMGTVGQGRPGRVISILCGRDGSTYRIVVERQDLSAGTRFLSWHRAPRFFGSLSDAARADLFDMDGRPTGHIVLDSGTGHVDFYDGGSRWAGYGVADRSSGKVQWLDVNGRRRESIALPIPSDVTR
jgi:hypothetical protein